jgi:hypothetical protein
MLTLVQIKASLGRKFRGSSLDDIQGISDFSLFAEAASNMLSEIDPYETVRLHRFDLFTGVTEYAPPNDLKGKKLIDPAPQDGEQGEDFNQTFTKEFRRDLRDYKVSVEFADGDKVLKARAPGRGSASTVDKTNAIGTWVGAGGATGVEIDSDLRLDGSDSLRADLGAAGGYLENVALDEIDLSAHEDSGSFFRKLYIPAGASTLTSVTILIGSAAGAYWSILGQAHFGSYKNGVNLVRFDWADAVETGVPDSTIVDYERLTFVTTAAIADVRVGPLTSRLPLPYETPYYSNRLFRDATTGDWLETPDDEENEVMLEKEAENIFFYECCRLISEDLSLDDEARKFESKLFGTPGKSTGLYAQYKEDKPTEKLRPQTRYIDLRNRRDRRGIRRR